MCYFQEKKFPAYYEILRKIGDAKVRSDVLKGYAQSVEKEHGRKEIKERLIFKTLIQTVERLWPEYTWRKSRSKVVG